MGTSANWEGEVTIQISAHLDITTTPSESRGQCHARVGTLGVEGMPAMHGIKLHTPSFHAEKMALQTTDFRVRVEWECKTPNLNAFLL